MIEKIILENGNLDFNWLSKNLIKCQLEINSRKNYNKIYKTHSIRSSYFTNETVNLGFIYIIRDPRDIVVSLSKHAGTTLDNTIDIIKNKKNLMSTANGANELISTWGENVISWLTYVNVSRLIIRYEDLVENTEVIILDIINFINRITNNELVNKNINVHKIIKNTEFKNLQKLETKYGFKEATKHTNFFRIGKTNQWMNVLSTNQIKKIELKYSKLMKDFKYL